MHYSLRQVTSLDRRAYSFAESRLSKDVKCHGSPDDLIPLANSGGCQFGLHELDERGSACLSKRHIVEPLGDAHEVNGSSRQNML